MTEFSKLKKNLLYWIGMMMGNSVLLYPLNFILPRAHSFKIPKDTDILIDGFQRSGNTFFYSLVRHANRDASILVHRHSSIYCIKALSKGVPTAVCIRQPLDTISSLLAWDPKLSVGIAIKMYIRYYNNLIPSKKKMLIVPFESMITDPDYFISKINEQFDIHLRPTEFNEQALAQFLERKKEKSRDRGVASAYPNAEKIPLKHTLKIKIEKHPQFKEALKSYESFCK